MYYVNDALNTLNSTKNLSKAEIRSHLDDHYDNFALVLSGVANGDLSLLINGPAGFGKTEFARKILSSRNDRKISVYNGSVSGVGLYETLYQNRFESDIVILDDTDTIISTDETVDILKAATDTQKGKTINWIKASNILREKGIPNSYEFKGKIVIITNAHITPIIKGQKTTKQQRRIQPLLDRVRYFKAGLPSTEWEVEALKLFADRDKINVFTENKVPSRVRKDILDFIEEEQDRLGEISFRLVIRLYDLYKLAGANRWKKLAGATEFVN